MSTQKTYINSVFINEKTFNDGGSILKVSIPADKIDAFAAQLKAAADEGWVSLVISRTRNPVTSKTTGRVISTHSLAVDTWKPTQGQSAPQRPAPDRSVPDDVSF